MITIQELGVEVLSNNPRSFYAWVGSEYGIKERYLSVLRAHYGDMKTVDSVSDVLRMMQTKRLIPLDPCLYVVRYDDSFLSSLNDRTEHDILRTKICGTIVCIYESDKAANKLLKYLPKCTASIESVDPKFIQRYLKSEFPKVCDQFLQFAASNAVNYSHARNMTRCAAMLDQAKVVDLSQEEMSSLFALSSSFSEAAFSLAFMRKDFSALYAHAQKYTGSVDDLIYMMLRTLIDLEKNKVRKPSDSTLAALVSRWTLEDIYNMFNHGYEALKCIRSVSVDPEMILIYLFGLIQFTKIPAKEVMTWS